MTNNNYEFRLLKITKSDHTDQVTITAQVRLPITHIGEQITQTIYREDANKILKDGINSQRAGITTDISDDSKIILYQQRKDKRNQILFQAELGFD